MMLQCIIILQIQDFYFMEMHQVLVIFFWVMLILHPLIVIAYRKWRGLLTTEVPSGTLVRSNPYLIQQHKQVKGVLLGSLHVSLTKDDVAFALELVKKYQNKVTAIFCEVNMAHHSLLQSGLEKHIFELLESHNIPQKALEKTETQQLFLYGIERVGLFIVGLPFPYWALQKFSLVCWLFAYLRKVALLPVTLLIGIFYSSLKEQLAIEDRETMSRVRADFFSGHSSLLAEQQAQAFYLKSRDAYYAESIHNYLTEKETHFPVIVIGSAHLSEQGLLCESLNKKGWQLVQLSSLEDLQ